MSQTTTTSTEPAPVALAPTWVMVVTGLLSLAGLGIAIYMTIVHFRPQALVCPTNGFVDCAEVTTSAQSYFLKVPVAIWGLGYYAVGVAMFSPWSWRSPRRWVHQARFAFISLGMAFVLWLIAAELVIIGKICEWCTTEHIVTFVLFVLTVIWVPRMLNAKSGPEEVE